MLTAAECEVYAKEFGSLARQPDISEDRAAAFKNVARTFKGLSGQLDRLAAMQRNDTKQIRPWLTALRQQQKASIDEEL